MVPIAGGHILASLPIILYKDLARIAQVVGKVDRLEQFALRRENTVESIHRPRAEVCWGGNAQDR